MTEHLRRSCLVPSPYQICFLYLGFCDRERLYERTNQRVDEVFRYKLVEEAKEFLEIPSSAAAMRIIGYKELLSYFRGEVSFPEAQDIIRREVRHYAKRQLTWFRWEEQVR